MKTALTVIGIIFAIFLIIIIGLNLYLTDERLKNMILPQINETLGREVEAERMSFTLFRTFPSAGVSITNFRIPEDDGTGTFASFQELIVSVRIIPLISGDVQVNRLDIDQLMFSYIVFEDGTTNIDFLMEDMEEPDPDEEAMVLDLRRVRVTNSRIIYEDRETNTIMLLDGLNMTTSLQMADVIESDIDARVDGLTVSIEGETYVNNLPLRLVQNSVIDMERETVELRSGNIMIRGLDLELTGVIQNWSADAPYVDLAFNSATDNFGDLLALVPDEYREYVDGYETRGSLDLRGTVTGNVGNEQIPAFNMILAVTDGYLQHPDVKEPIRDIQISMEANNDRVQIAHFTAGAGDNNLAASGFVNNPLEDDADFNMSVDMNLDMATIRNFYPLEQHGVELRGNMVLNSRGEGVISDPENIRFNADIDVRNGYLKYEEVDEPVENVNFVVNATQDRITIQSLQATASVNNLDLSGVIDHPMDEERTQFDLRAKLNLDLATIKDFYPIDEDTLQMRGKLNFDGTATGRTADAENANVNGTLTLADGFIRYHEFPHPIEDIVFQSQIRGNTITISNSSLRTGSNQMAISGTVTDYMAENPQLNLQLNGAADLGELGDFYSMEDFVTHLAGSAMMNLRVTGRADQVENLSFNGNFSLSDGAIHSDSLPQPITNLNASLQFSNNVVEVQSYTMNMGSSDFNLSGRLTNYMALAADEPQSPASLTATYRSQLLNVDELYDWDSEAAPDDEEYPIELPNLNSTLEADITRILILGVSITNVRGTMETRPDRIAFRNTTAELFDGTISGELTWNVPQPERTEIVFSGSMADVRVESFFEEFSPIGNSNIHKYLSGGFNLETTYSTMLDIHLDPVIETTSADGTFLMDDGSLQGHPMQNRLADLLGIAELRNLGIDDIDTKYGISNGTITFEHFNLTSRDLGLQLDGTQNLISDEINFRLSLILPGRLAQYLQPIITQQGVNAITRDDGKMVLPITATGTSENPTIGVDTAQLEAVIKDRLTDEAGDRVRDALRGILRRN